MNNKSKTVVITGATSGIGLHAATKLAQNGNRLHMLCRNPVKAKQAQERILNQAPQASIQLWPVDLADLNQVRSFANKFLGEFDAVDVLINNAGLYPVRQAKTTDGFEMQFGVNYLSHVLLSHLMLPALKKSGDGRIVHVSSIAHYFGRIDYDSFHGRNRYFSLSAYAQSKLGNVMLNSALATRLPPEVTTLAIHPGGVDSDFYRDLPKPIYYGLKPFLIGSQRAAELILDISQSPEWRQKSGRFVSAHGPLPKSRYLAQSSEINQLYLKSCNLLDIKPIGEA